MEGFYDLRHRSSLKLRVGDMLATDTSPQQANTSLEPSLSIAHRATSKSNTCRSLKVSWQDGIDSCSVVETSGHSRLQATAAQRATASVSWGVLSDVSRSPATAGPLTANRSLSVRNIVKMDHQTTLKRPGKSRCDLECTVHAISLHAMAHS